MPIKVLAQILIVLDFGFLEGKDVEFIQDIRKWSPVPFVEKVQYFFSLVYQFFLLSRLI